MFACPICSSPMISSVCLECGYDESLDIRNYLTLSPIPPESRAPFEENERRYRRREESPGGVLVVKPEEDEKDVKLKYNVDIAMCIDATGSMDRLIDTVKSNALNFYADLTKAMAEKGKHIDALRVRIIAFRDYLADGEKAMLATDFYTLPQEAKEFERLLNSIEAGGGGDDPEDGLEALAYAIRSKWTTEGDKRRHVIVVWTDEGTHELGFGAKPENRKAYYNVSRAEAEKRAAMYPKRMAADFDELTDWWGDEIQPGLMDNEAKRLILYAPEKKYWTTVAQSWEKVVPVPSQAGNGLKELEYNEILDKIANSI